MNQTKSSSVEQIANAQINPTNTVFRGVRTPVDTLQARPIMDDRGLHIVCAIICYRYRPKHANTHTVLCANSSL